MKLNDTVIEKGGVLRCCLGTVAAEYADKEFELGAKSECGHCHEPFTLVAPDQAGRTCYSNLTRPIWKPDWQLKETA